MLIFLTEYTGVINSKIAKHGGIRRSLESAKITPTLNWMPLQT